MNSDRAYRRGVLACVLLSTGIYGVASGELVILIGAWIVAGLFWWVTDGGRGKAWPRPVANVMLLIVALYTARGVFDGGLNVDDFSQLVVGLLLVKLVDRRSARDDGQLLTLAAFLAIGAILTSTALLIGLGLVLFVPVLLATGIRYQILATRAEAEQSNRPARRERDPARVGGLISGVTVTAAIVAAVVFVVFPRGIGRDVFGSWGNAAVGRQTGFAPEINLGVGGLINDVQTPVIDLRITDDQGRVIGSENEVQYLRGSVLDVYRDGRWGRSSVRSQDAERLERVPGRTWVRPAGVGSSPSRVRRAQVTIRDTPSGRVHHIFTLHETVGLRFGTRTQVQLSRRDGQALRSGAGGQLVYEVEFRPMPEVSAFESVAHERGSITFPSAIVLAEARLALEPRGIAVDPAERDPSDDALAVRAIETYLRENFTYTLDTLAPPPRRDPIDWFLTDARTGHCEYYASAMAAMCRAIGVNARVVTGYVAAEFNNQTGTYVVRSSNAHAWVEAETRPGQWRTYDPTPPAEFSAIHRPQETAGRMIRRWLNAIEYAWINSVVGYQGRAEREDGAASRDDGPLDAGAIEGTRAVSVAVLNALLVAAGAVVVAYGAWMLSVAIARRVGPRARRQPAHLRFYEDALRALTKRGVPKPASRPPLAHARAIGVQDPDAGAAFAELGTLYYDARFGGRPLGETERSRIGQLLGVLLAPASKARGGSENR